MAELMVAHTIMQEVRVQCGDQLTHTWRQIDLTIQPKPRYCPWWLWRRVIKRVLQLRYWPMQVRHWGKHMVPLQTGLLEDNG